MTEFDDLDVEDEGSLSHIGIKRRSGRYPWGSGKDPLQRANAYQTFIKDLEKQGLSETQIANHINDVYKLERHERLSSTDLRAGTSIATETIRTNNIMTAQKLRAERDFSPSAIAKRMSTADRPVNESTVRGWLAAYDKGKYDEIQKISDVLKKQLETKPYLDVGAGTELHMGISKVKLNAALVSLKDEGYNVHPLKQPQLGTGEPTNVRMLTKGDVDWKTARDNLPNIQNVTAYIPKGGEKFVIPGSNPISLDSKRIEFRYDEDGGTQMDGVIQLRRGVKDLDLGENRYAQVRIAVDGTHYLKGMAMYTDDLPPGKDVRFNTNKSKEVGPLKAMKELKPEGDGNRFGASIDRVQVYKDKNGKEKDSPLNLVNEEGKWDDWSKSLSSQMLSKQSVGLANTQLSATRKKAEEELRKINSLTNPIVKQKLLAEYADNTDAAAVHLKAAAMDRQATKVLLPMNSMRPGEIFAPDYKTGERVALVRYPHGGPFEIPELVVNNNNVRARRIMGGARDAVGIHHSVAEKLSGADFDGDTVLVIPNDHRKIKSKDPLPGLVGFDAKKVYKIPDDDTTTPRMTKKNTQTEMGKVSNLITDMTIRGATDAEKAAAVRHSMVVIDAEKHGLDYKRSERDNMISDLKAKYQKRDDSNSRGASTIISRASAELRIPERRLARVSEGGPINPKTGELNWVPTDRKVPERKLNKATGEYELTGGERPRTTKGTRMEFAKDANDLVSGADAPPMERIYADHANRMKGLANQARLDMINTKVENGRSSAAESLYSKEVASLKAKLKVAQKNAPLERQAQAIAGGLAKAKIDAHPEYDKAEIKRVKYQALDEGRRRTGAGKEKIGSRNNPLTDREWDAIQSRAISPTMLRDILANADMDRVRELATPRPRTSLTTGQQARIRAMQSSGRSPTEIAEALGIPRSTVVDNIKGSG